MEINSFEGLLEKLGADLTAHGISESFARWRERIASEVPDSPFFYQVIAMTLVCDESCLLAYRTKRFEIGAKKMRKLRGLDSRVILENVGLNLDYDQISSLPISSGYDSSFYEDRDLRNGMKRPTALRDLFVEAVRLSATGLTVLSGIPLPYQKDSFQEAHDRMSEFLNRFDRGVERNIRAAKSAIKFLRGAVPLEARPAIERTYNLQRERALRDFLALKLARKKELMGVDEILANTYFKYSPLVHTAIDIVCSRDKTFKRIPLSFRDFPDFVRLDEKLYQQLLDRISVKADEIYVSNPRGNGSSADSNARHDVLKQPSFIHEQNPQQILIDAIVSKYENEFSNDAMARVRKFVSEDVARYGGESSILQDSFTRFRLGKRLRGVEDVHLRNFFDDIMLNYLMCGKSPSSEDLEAVYSQCKN